MRKGFFILFSIFLLFTTGLSSLLAQDGTKVITGITGESRVIESKENIEIKQFSAENNSDVSVTSEKEIVISAGTNIWEGSDFAAKSDTVTGDYDTLVNVENIAPPQSVSFNTTPSNIEAVDPMTGIVELEAPSPNIMGTAEMYYPIWVPEGINGLTPEISLLYSSDTLEGNCGYGWSLEQNRIEHNLKKGLPAYSLNKIQNDNSVTDQLALNEQELVYTGQDSSGNKVYRQKVDTGFIRILEDSNRNFSVYSPDGSIIHYGSSLNSRVYNPDNTAEVFAWHINEVNDKWGNKITYDYVSSGNEKYVSKIKYGYTDSTAHLYEIRFIWVTREDDIRINFNSGFYMDQSKILKRVEVHSTKAGCLKRYDLNYSKGIFQKNLLTSIKEYADETTTTLLNHHSFSYDTSDNNKFAPEEKWDFFVTEVSGSGVKICGTSSAGTFYSEDDEFRFADLNGDSCVDVIRIKKDLNGNDYKIIVERNMGSGFLAPVTWMENITWPADKQVLLDDIKDLNNDGLADLIFVQSIEKAQSGSSGHGTYVWEPEKMWFYENTGSGFTYRGDNWLNASTLLGDFYSTFASKKSKAFTDVNMDKLVDLFVYDSSNNNILFLNSKHGFTGPGKTINEFGAFLEKSQTKDLNGDSFPDDQASGYKHNYYDMNMGNSIETGTKRFIVPIADNPMWADINGDDLPDYLSEISTSGERRWSLHLNNGKDFEAADFNWFALNVPSNQGVSFIDLNGDGAADILRQEAYNSWYVSLNHLGNKNVLTRVYNNITGIAVNLEYDTRYADPHYSDKHHYRQQFVLSSTTIENTLTDPTGNNKLRLQQFFTYDRGIYDHFIKEFRGFEKVTTETVDTTITDRVVKGVSTTKFNILCFDEDGLFDDYLVGSIYSQTDWMVDGPTWIPRSRIEYKYSKFDILNGYPEVKFVGQTETRQWFYKDDGSFIDPADSYAVSKGYPVETISYTFDKTTGVISSVSKTDSADPFHTLDDTVSTTTFVSNTAGKWLCYPYEANVFDGDNNLLSKTTSYFDNKTAGTVTNGILTKKQIWNNNTHSNDGDAVTTYEYDGYGNLVRGVAGSTKLFINSTAGSTAIEYAPASDTDCFMKVTATQPDGLMTTTKYNWYGDVTDVTAGTGDRTEYTYDSYGRIKESKEFWGDNKTTVLQIVNYGYQNGLFYAKAQYMANRKSTATDYAFLCVEYYSDCLGRTVQVKTEGEVYNPQLKQNEQVWGLTGVVEYDTLGRAVKTGAADKTAFSNAGYIQINLLDPATSVEYDRFGRISRKIMPSGLVLTYFYDLLIGTDTAGNERILSETRVTDNQGHEVVLYNDLSGSKVHTKVLKDDEGNYAETFYIRDLYGNEETITPTGKSITRKTDSLGRLWQTQTPDAGLVTYQYRYKDQVSRIDEEGQNSQDEVRQTRVFSYDRHDRLETVNIFNDSVNDLKYEYYPSNAAAYDRSQVKTIYKGDIDTANYPFEISYNYDKFSSRGTKKIDNRLFTTIMETDFSGQVQSIIYPDTTRVNYKYNRGGMLDSIQNSNGTWYVKSMGYDKFGQRVHIEYGNGVKANYNYDPVTLVLDTYDLFNKSESKILAYDYDFDLNGNIVKIRNNTQKGSTQNYDYDKLGRLIHADGVFNYGTISDSYTRYYQYNDDSRLVRKLFASTRGGTGQYNYVHDSMSNEIHYIFDGTGDTIINFTYDDFGNMTQKTYADDPNKNQSMEYGSNNRMATLSGGNYNLAFEYDHKGQRVRKSYSTGSRLERTFMYVNGFYTANDIGGNGSFDVENRHIWDGSNLIATEIANDPAKTQYYHSNHIGSTAMLTDSDGNEQRRYLYFPYGETWVSLENSDNNRDGDTNKLFTGQEKDKESGLYYYNARYYDSDICVFTRPDPAMDGANHYGYVVGNPVMYNDPTGLRRGPRSGYGTTMRNKMRKAGAATAARQRNRMLTKAKLKPRKGPVGEGVPNYSVLTAGNLIGACLDSSLNIPPFNAVTINLPQFNPVSVNIPQNVGGWDPAMSKEFSQMYGEPSTSEKQALLQYMLGTLNLGAGAFFALTGAGAPLGIPMMISGVKNMTDASIKMGVDPGWQGMTAEGLGFVLDSTGLVEGSSLDTMKSFFSFGDSVVDAFIFPSVAKTGEIGFFLNLLIGMEGVEISEAFGSLHSIEFGCDGDAGSDSWSPNVTPRNTNYNDFMRYLYMTQ